MKKLLLLLLACGMYVSAFAQPEVPKKNTESSDKWVTTPVTNMKGVLGRLDINFPADVERSILIYQQTDNKFLRSVSRNDKIYTIAPGQYRFTLTNVPVDNVPIQKGHETRLKAGFLDIVSEGDWHLYDETKEKAYTSGNKPKKLPLPVGRYQIKLGGQFFPVIIKDGETVEDYSTIVIENNVSDNYIITREKYTMVPIAEEQGRLATKFPLATTDAFFPISTIITIYTENDNFIYSCGNAAIPCQANFPLPEGNYNIHIGLGTSYRSIITVNVEIRKGYETRLKVGYLSHLARGKYRLYDESMNKYMMYDSQGPAAYALPIGRYWVELFYVGKYKVEMKDGHVSVLNPVDSAAAPKYIWTIKPISRDITKPATGLGRLNSYFPKEENTDMAIQIPKSSGSGYTTVKLDTLKFFDLLPGNYPVYLNNVRLELPIESGKETNIRFGYLDISGAGGESWSLYNEGSLALTNGSGGARMLALPIGFYRVRINSRSYLIKINDGEKVEFPGTY